MRLPEASVHERLAARIHRVKIRDAGCSIARVAHFYGFGCSHRRQLQASPLIGRSERGEADRAFLPWLFTDSKSDTAIGTKAMGSRCPANRSPLVPSMSSRGEEGYIAGLHDQVDSIASCLRFRAEAGAVQGGVTIPQLNASAYARRSAGAWRSLMATCLSWPRFAPARAVPGTRFSSHRPALPTPPWPRSIVLVRPIVRERCTAFSSHQSS